MKIGNTTLIPQNIAPINARKAIISDSNGNKVCEIPLGRLQQPSGSPQYKFCALSDTHLTYDTANADFQRALTYAESNCDFICIAGDLVSTGVESEMQTFKNIVDTYAPTKPVYAITGNHENYSVTSKNFLQTYTEHPLYYSFTKGDDVFIMLGHYGGYAGDGIGWKSDEFLSVDEIQWLYETLESNRNKRCFVFNHVLPYSHGVGNPNNLYGQRSSAARLWEVNDGGIGQLFINLLRHYKNTILFHGHSHTQFKLQEVDDKANYSSVDGYRSIHIPSLSVPRDIADDGTALTDVFAESEGYIVDVYDDYIVLNGRDFIDNDNDGNILPIATYKIDTKLVDVPANTFVDNTGTITT